MTFKIYTAVFILISISAACGNSKKKDDYDYTISTTPAAQPAAAPGSAVTQPATVQQGNVPVTPGAVASAPQPQPVAIQPAQASNSGGLNPAHGAPGHRCDIAVGAPLNSAPAAQAAVAPATTQQIQESPPIQVSKPVQAPVQKTAPGMNPPHGQPGHRCDISVGAPLNSKPVPVTPTMQAPPTPVATPVVTDSAKGG